MSIFRVLPKDVHLTWCCTFLPLGTQHPGPILYRLRLFSPNSLPFTKLNPTFNVQSPSQRHVWRHQFAICVQLLNQSADNWLCSLRAISRKCDFGENCFALGEPARTLGQLISGVVDNSVRIKLLELGDALTLDQTLTILRSAETSQLQAATHLADTRSQLEAIPHSPYRISFARNPSSPWGCRSHLYRKRHHVCWIIHNNNLLACRRRVIPSRPHHAIRTRRLTAASSLLRDPTETRHAPH